MFPQDYLNYEALRRKYSAPGLWLWPFKTVLSYIKVYPGVLLWSDGRERDRPRAFLSFQGARVWLKDPDRVWVSANVTKDFDGKTLLIETEDLETKEIAVRTDEDLPPLRNPDILIGENDLTSLSYLHEPAVLHNLSVRFLDSRQVSHDRPISIPVVPLSLI